MSHEKFLFEIFLFVPEIAYQVRVSQTKTLNSKKLVQYLQHGKFLYNEILYIHKQKIALINCKT